ncbi:hypothetical protein IQ03_00432 [Gemmobacter caeni]|uniref:Hemolysin n=1 Tax=Gemmobacter caeni TaxID=589035 RepID=A0A2T6BBY6_9RHOB|nr:DUF333 domain-containing protein [Gemmobacter caeni]PTX53516.1 hypothetical protein C8N34_101434 [Gemmobacter caeni]TWJ05627.1 hypothetical protein IQ03_00432 [Gemmobacter caeni]
MPFRPALAFAALALCAGCGGGGGRQAAEPSNSRWASMSNPASQYCAELGGRLEMRQEQAGEAGYCHMPDGTVVEEWQLYRGKNAL